MRRHAALLSSILFVVVVLQCFEISNAQLQPDFYSGTCPLAETIVRNITWNAVAANLSLPAKLLRLHFHDCFVRGCDASILLDPSTENPTPEKQAPPNLSIAGYEVIDEIKENLEAICPGVVSCADIVALAARDAVAFQFQESKWEVLTGREDGRVSNAVDALANLPPPTANFSSLLSQFQSLGLNATDLVALSGAHTIGVTHCTAISTRLYNFTGNNDTDPALDPNYAAYLKSICPLPANASTQVEMDPGSSLCFDTHYYTALNSNEGIFVSDATLLTDPNSALLAQSFEQADVFFAQFAQSMLKMGAIGVLTNGGGEIRQNCRAVNSISSI